MAFSSVLSIPWPIPMAMTVTFGTLWSSLAAWTVAASSFDFPSVSTTTYFWTWGRAPWLAAGNSVSVSVIFHRIYSYIIYIHQSYDK